MKTTNDNNTIENLMFYPKWTKTEQVSLGYWNFGYNVFQGDVGVTHSRCVTFCKSHLEAHLLSERLEEKRDSIKIIEAA